MEDEISEYLEILKPIAYMEVGSRVTCNPPPIDTDLDVLILLKERQPSVLSGLGFDLDTRGAHYEPSQGQFNSWRKGELNFIVTDSLIFYERFTLATKGAKALNLLEKEDRINLFQAILYDNI